jgi:hypothetical protein
VPCLFEEGGELFCALGRAEGAQATALAREPLQVPGPRPGVAYAGRAIVQDAAVEVGADGLLGYASPEAVTTLTAWASLNAQHQDLV